MISERLKAVIRRELDLPDLVLDDGMLAREVPGWDSLRHLSIIAAIEGEFGIRLKSLEIMRLKNLGELQALVDRKTGKN
ncbi:MAG TPA: acyl carrier protein [Thermoanaerobaculia bacterium]|nr:acyl carrier protein [Thermoanaerobaculia bacterium]